MIAEKKVLIISDSYREYSSALSVMTHARQKFYHITLKDFEKVNRVDSFDIILLDCDRDMLKGIEMLKKIKHYSPQNLIVLIGYSDSVECVTDAFRLGARDYIRKPVDLEKLRKTVSFFCHIRNGVQEKRPVFVMPASNAPERETPADQPTLIQNARRYIDSNVAGDICLDELANLAKMSKFHFIRRFRDLTGHTPKQYIILKRIERAREMLREKRHNISDLSANLGFCSSSDFSMHFKKIVGQTPSQYKKGNGTATVIKR